MKIFTTLGGFMAISMVNVYRRSQRQENAERIEDASLEQLEAWLLRSESIAQTIRGAMLENPEWWNDTPTMLAAKLSELPGVGEASAALYVAMYTFAAKVRRKQAM